MNTDKNPLKYLRRILPNVPLPFDYNYYKQSDLLQPEHWKLNFNNII